MLFETKNGVVWKAKSYCCWTMIEVLCFVLYGPVEMGRGGTMADEMMNVNHSPVWNVGGNL